MKIWRGVKEIALKWNSVEMLQKLENAKESWSKTLKKVGVKVTIFKKVLKR